MPPSDRQQRLAALRDIIADIERKPALAEARERIVLEEGRFPVFGGGLVQEVFTDSVRDGGASLAFALGQAKGLLDAHRPMLLYLQLTQDAQFFGLPYGPGLSHFGFDPKRLLIVRTPAMADMLWTAEEALGCRAIAGIVAEIGAVPAALDFTASRRLSLRASETGTSLYVLRYGQMREASAAHLRWHLQPERSARKPYDPTAPGAARWRLRLERGVVLKRSDEWLLEWRKNDFTTLTPHHPARRGAPISQPVPAALANRLSQTG